MVSTRLSMLDVVGHFVIWFVVILFTLGIGLLFWPYAMAKLIINSIVVDGRPLKCDLRFGGTIGHIIMWMLLLICTVGFAYPFYFFGVVRTALNTTKVE